METIFIKAFFGHLFGDFVFQSKKMALMKSDKTKSGLFYCTIHVFIYTAIVTLFIQTTSYLVVASIFIPHWIIDRYSLANYWLKLIKGRTFEDAFMSQDKYREFDIAFTSIVYTITDMTFHMFSLWLVIVYLI